MKNSSEGVPNLLCLLYAEINFCQFEEKFTRQKKKLLSLRSISKNQNQDHGYLLYNARVRGVPGLKTLSIALKKIARFCLNYTG